MPHVLIWGAFTSPSTFWYSRSVPCWMREWDRDRERGRERERWVLPISGPNNIIMYLNRINLSSLHYLILSLLYRIHHIPRRGFCLATIFININFRMCHFRMTKQCMVYLIPPLHGMLQKNVRRIRRVLEPNKLGYVECNDFGHLLQIVGSLSFSLFLSRASPVVRNWVRNIIKKWFPINFSSLSLILGDCCGVLENGVSAAVSSCEYRPSVPFQMSTQSG